MQNCLRHYGIESRAKEGLDRRHFGNVRRKTGLSGTEVDDFLWCSVQNFSGCLAGDRSKPRLFLLRRCGAQDHTGHGWKACKAFTAAGRQPACVCGFPAATQDFSQPGKKGRGWRFASLARSCQVVTTQWFKSAHRPWATLQLAYSSSTDLHHCWERRSCRWQPPL